MSRSWYVAFLAFGFALSRAVAVEAAVILPEVVASFTSPLGAIHAMTWGDDSLWLVEENGKVYRLSPSGQVQSSYDLPPAISVSSVTDLAWFENSLWVHTGNSGSKTYKLDAAGAVVETLNVGYWPGSGMEWVEGELYVGDYNFSDVHKHSRSGSHIFSWPTDGPIFGHPMDMVYDGASLWIADSCEGFNPNRLYQFSLTGTPGDVINLAPATGSCAAGISTRKGLAYDGRYFWYALGLNIYKLNIGGDDVPPTASVVSPSGGEYWLLSSGSPSNTEVVTWAMADNVRICRVDVSLWHSNDGGTTYFQTPSGGGLPASFGPGGVCTGSGEHTTSLTYTIPATPPSGAPGSLYKIQVEVTDAAGNKLVLDPASGLNAVRSANPFYIVNPNPDSVRTLILSNVPRMGLSSPQAAALNLKLQELSDHPRVQGLIVDLASVTSVSSLYADWDAAPGDVDAANRVLFGCHNPCTPERDGIHDLLRQSLLPAYGGVKHAVVVGDDRIIPLARLGDQTGLLKESKYVQRGGLTANGTRVGAALDQDNYLSDDLLGVTDPVSLSDLGTKGFVPALSVGRLVESASEIQTTIATFISQDGVLDLGLVTDNTKHKVLVTGYDFLTDSARQIRSSWKKAFTCRGLTGGALQTCLSDDGSLASVDGQLLGGDWNLPSVNDRVNALQAHLSGNGGASYGVMSLSGHATHYQEGVPGTGAFDIQGLDSSALLTMNLAGGVIYSVGCHSGLNVAGSTDPADHPLDLAQAFLSKGVVAYVANTGYGWGLKHGIGYSERLVQLLTEQMTKGGTILIGDAVAQTKRQYASESRRRGDPFNVKSQMQWTLFGLPMYAVKTGIPSPTTPGAFEAPVVASRGSVEGFGPVSVTRSLGEAAGALAAPVGALPDYLTQLTLHFNFSAAGVYRKWKADGTELSLGTPCLPGGSDGCYYTLNGIVERASGDTDLPVQPYFIYDSRLSGTSQHGVLWKGGEYDEETGWKPVFAELASNLDSGAGDADPGDHGPAPEDMMVEAIDTRILPGKHPDSCGDGDQELNSLVVGAGEALKGADLEYSIERRYRGVDLEVFYFNNTDDTNQNCDRVGPQVTAGPYHGVVGSTLNFSVGASDSSGVWRVLVVYTDNLKDALGRGRWRPLELLYNTATQRWEGSVVVPLTTRATYAIQAVDNRGNVSWVRYQNSTLPTSGLALGVPEATRVSLVEPRRSTDFNGDGRTDLLWRHKTSGDAYLWLMDGEQSLSQHFLGLVGTPWKVMGTGDHDGDGKADILWRHPDGYIYLWLMDGQNLLGQGLVGDLVADADWEIVGSGDHTGDRKADILWRHKLSGDLVLWEMNGLGTPVQQYVGNLDASWKVVGSGDANGDGKADILWRQDPNGWLYVWLMDGATQLSQHYLDTVSDLDWEVTGHADFDGDLRADILWRNKTTGDVWLWGMDGGAITSRSYVGTGAATEWEIVGSGDQSGDGKADVLWRHKTRGDLYLWVMEGPVIISQGFAGSVGTDWEVVGMR